MRTPIYVLIAALFVSGCSTHYHQAPPSSTSRPADRIEQSDPEPVEPLELDIGRPSGGQLLLQTNRPAYVAIFEIIPNRGVTLIYPAAVHQQRMLVSGLTWVPLWWSPKRVTFSSDRYIYAVASEEPLDLTDETFIGGYFHRVLGPGIYLAERPYATMRAISRAVVPDIPDEQWAEDVYVLTPTYFTETHRTARIYCPGGRVFEVPEDMAARIWCPTRTRVVIIDASRPRSRDYPVGRPARPDSVYGPGGRVRLEPRRPRRPIVRVVDPSGRDERDERDRGRDRRRADDDSDSDSEKPEKEKDKRSRMMDLIRDTKREEQERAKEERERQRREAEEARRREADERRDAREEREERKEERKEERRDDREARKDDRDARKEERRDERDARKDEREERKDERKEERREERKDEPKQQGQPSEEKREEKREEPRDDNKRRGMMDLIKAQKEKEKEKKEKP